MTDKQIIDGKECRYWFRPNPDDYRKCSLRGKNDNCDEITDCFIKELLGKLALKEQECEELKKTVMYKCPQCGEEYLSPIGASLYEENYQLKAENDELKRQHQGDKGLITSTGKMNYQLLQEYDKLKTTLTEIKEIARQEIDSKEFMIVQCMLNGNVDDKNKVLKQILQKISECEVE